MNIVVTTTEMRDWASAGRRDGKKIALVPTMGFFHQGHVSLMRRAAELADLVVVSLFVNPIQFGPNEDLGRYPRDLDRDTALALENGVDILFVPTADVMYPVAPRTRISVPSLADRLCGLCRPGHFDGVCTVVGKFFNIVRPDVAVFGRKDFQQLAVLRRMTLDLNWDVEIVAHPIVRESDGLAMSSRNCYLSPAERVSALCLYQSLERARKLVAAGERDAARLLAEVRDLVAEKEGVQIEYTEIVDAQTLESQLVVDERSLLALAVLVGNTRLIDNAMLMASSW